MIMDVSYYAQFIIIEILLLPKWLSTWVHELQTPPLLDWGSRTCLCNSYFGTMLKLYTGNKVGHGTDITSEDDISSW